jgi:hypothetical protein
MKFEIAGEDKGEKKAFFTTRVDESGDFAIFVNGVEVMYLSSINGSIWRYSQEIDERRVLEKVGFEFGENDCLLVEPE